MKTTTGIVLLILLSACSEDGNKIKDLRGNDPQIEQEFSDEEPLLNETASEQKLTDSMPTLEKSEWSYEVVLTSENNWGYQIFQKGKMIINQTSIPSVQGTAGFDSQEKAERTANYILNKIENGVFPPTVNKEELERLNVLRD